MPDLVIRLKHDNEILLSADEKHVRLLDNKYYIHPDLVDISRFEISDRIYNCPSKGKARWVDLKTEKGWLNDICWVFPDPKPKYIQIAGWFGFTPGHKHYEIET